MSNIIYNNSSFDVTEGNSVLDTLLKAGIPVPFSCRSGVCQSCLMTLEAGEVPTQALEGLNGEQLAQQLFLSCCCYPQQDLSVRHYDPRANGVTAQVVSKRLLSQSVLELTLDAAIAYQAGQHTNLWRNEKITRCYSIASIPSDPHLRFHITLQPNGQFSQWAWQSLQPGDPLTLQEARGECYYQTDNPSQPLLLAGTGTGLAPLQAITRAALEAGHRGEITLIMGGRNDTDLYFNEPLLQLEREHDNVRCIQLAQRLSSPNANNVRQADIYQYVKEHFSDLNSHVVYLCGADTFVRKMRKQCFFAGVKPRNVYSDTFLPAN
ncbi:2Fe-2S iron-sulfur cluster-binding protein [Gilvimarinus agarilyticus]|uniref:2Fe-2S iron-sulfur cluster-binding protein n=1 Tax=Gilvimarinus agarilyticus TaxID=679259 RepID=UPI000A002530|nr:2Fe-2S iron-sulfur cluster-binding protein [Gilvimarinus agarilyticus]